MNQNQRILNNAITEVMLMGVLVMALFFELKTSLPKTTLLININPKFIDFIKGIFSP